MWLITKRGFYSVTRIDEATLQIRSRSRADLEALRELDGDLAHREILEIPNRDYPFRIYAPDTSWARVHAALANEIDYGNFKDAVKEINSQRARTYGRVWGVLHSIEREGREDEGEPQDTLWEDFEATRALIACDGCGQLIDPEDDDADEEMCGRCWRSRI